MVDTVQHEDIARLNGHTYSPPDTDPNGPKSGIDPIDPTGGPVATDQPSEHPVEDDETPRRRIRDDNPLYKEINRYGFTDGTSLHVVAYMNPTRTRLYVKEKREVQIGENTSTRYYFYELPTPCPRVEHVIRFSDEAATPDQRVLYSITIAGQTEIVSADDIQTMKAWAVWGIGPTRKICALLAQAVFAQLTTHRTAFNIPQLQGEASNGWRVASNGTHYYLTPGGQVIGAAGILDEPSRMRVAVRPRSAYQYDARDAAITQRGLDELLIFWRDVCADGQSGIFLMGSVARMLANDLARTPGGMLLIGETATGKSALANLMRAAHATVHRKLAFMGTGSDRPGGLELAVSQFQSTVMVIDDGQGDGQDRRKTAKIVDSVLRSYHDQEPMARRSSSKMQATPDHVVQTAPIIIMEELVPESLDSALNRSALLDFGFTKDRRVRIEDVIRPRMSDTWPLMKSWGFSFLCWLAGAWDADITLPDRLFDKEREIAAKIASYLERAGDGDTSRIIDNFAGFITGWWLISEYAKARGFTLPYAINGLIAWAATKVQEQAIKINHSSMDVPGGLPFGEWACSVIRMGIPHGHVDDRETGRAPRFDDIDPSQFGWTVRYVGNEDYANCQGPQWGHADRDNGNLYLRPEIVMDALRTAARIEHRPMPGDNRKVWDRLVDDGIITRDGNRKAAHVTRIKGERSRRIIIHYSQLWSIGTDEDEDEGPPALNDGTFIDAPTNTPEIESANAMPASAPPAANMAAMEPAPVIPFPSSPAPLSADAQAYLALIGTELWGAVPWVRRAIAHYEAIGSPPVSVPHPTKRDQHVLLQGKALIQRLALYINSTKEATRAQGEELIRGLAHMEASAAREGVLA